MPSTGHSQQAGSKAKACKVGEADAIMGVTSFNTVSGFGINSILKLFKACEGNNKRKKLTSAS